MRKNKLFLLLALLLTAATGAWADETPLLTIESKDYTSFLSGSMTFDDKVTITFSNEVKNVGDNWGWYAKGTESLLTVAGTNGYTITSCKFYTAEAEETGYTVEGESPSVYLSNKEVYTDANQSVYLGCWGVTKIEVFGTAAATGYTVSMKDGVKDADKWTVKVGEGQAQALPIGGLKGDGSETVTLQYNGRLKVKGVKATSDAAPADPLAVPLTIEAITAGTINVLSPKEGMQYSKNGGAKTAVTTSIDVAAGDKVAFYGNGTSITSYSGTIITGSGDGFTCKVYGNIMSLVDEENFATAKKLSENYTFKSLFSGFTKLTDASGLLLPATQLTTYCYYSMFQGCSALTTAPELPATQLANNCYYSMFQYCNNLTAAPELKATQLAESCYRQMFHGCSALTAAPVLPAETLVGNCYRQMFYNCSKLATVTCLATSGIDVSNSTTNWLNSAGSDAQGTKTFYTSSSADWPSGNNGIPEGWVREVATTDAQAAKPAATVTAAPTGAAIVGVGKTTALVSDGVADGGTLMYAVTTTNTKPASTDGFSGAVPTAQTITASGTVYVWYYVKGNDTHSDSEIAATAIEVPVADIVWDITNVSDIYVGGDSYMKEDVTLSANAEDIHAGWNETGDPKTEGISFQVFETGGFTFTAPTGKAFTKIEMTLIGSEGWDIADLGTGWTFDGDFLNEIFTVTWTGSAASTDELLKDVDDFVGADVKSIAFYLSE